MNSDVLIIGVRRDGYIVMFTFFRRIRKIARSDYYLRHVCLSVRPHGTTRLSLEGFSLNFIFEDFTKICKENSSFIKIGQEQQRYFTWRPIYIFHHILLIFYHISLISP